MINKLYEGIKENYKTLLFFIILFLIFCIKLPLYISAPGGIINTDEKIKISSDFKLKGSLNMAFVSQIDGNVPILLYALVNPNWDIEREKDITTGSESPEDMEYRNKMLLKEANNTALLVAFNHSNTQYKTENHKIYITYIDDLAKTNLKLGDQIIKVDGHDVLKKKDLYDYISTKKPADKVEFTVIRKGKQKKCISELINIENEAKVGVVITEVMDIKSDTHVEFKFKDSESGSSGGLITALTIYSYLNKIDLTAGKKIVATGTIDIDGNVGEISGIKYKLIGAVKEKADVFLVPQGKNYTEARDLKNKKGYDIDIIPVETFEEALKYLQT